MSKGDNRNNEIDYLNYFIPMGNIGHGVYSQYGPRPGSYC